MKVLLYHRNDPPAYLVPIMKLEGSVRFRVVLHWDITGQTFGATLDLSDAEIAQFVRTDPVLDYSEIFADGLNIPQTEAYARCLSLEPPDTSEKMLLDFLPLGVPFDPPSDEPQTGVGSLTGNTPSQAQSDTEVQEPKRRRFQSAARTNVNSVKTGYRFGVATWNVHGLDKRETESVEWSLGFAPYLKDPEITKADDDDKELIAQLLVRYKKFAGDPDANEKKPADPAKRQKNLRGKKTPLRK